MAICQIIILLMIMLFVSEMSLLAACFNSIAERHNNITFHSLQKRDGS
jgi:hypothetical protein